MATPAIKSVRLSKKRQHLVFEGFDLKFGVRVNNALGFLPIDDANAADAVLAEVQANLASFTFGVELYQSANINGEDKLTGKSYEVVVS